MVLDTRINSYTKFDQLKHSSATLTDGGFIVTWTSQGQDGNSWGIYGQLYDSNGNTQGAEFRVNSNTLYAQQYPSVAALTNGGFVVTWASWEGLGNDIYGQRYDIEGSKRGDEFLVNSSYTGDQNSAVSALKDGGFVVIWTSFRVSGPGIGHGIYGQRFDASGTAQGAEFRVDSDKTIFSSNFSTTELTTGGFVVVWVPGDQAGNGVYGRRYDGNGIAQGAAFRINSDTENGSSPSVTALNNGGFAVSWSSSDGSDSGIYGQRFDASGSPHGAEFLVNSYTTNYQSDSSLTSLANGGFVVTWTSGGIGYLGQDGSGSGIYGQRFDSSGTPHSAEFLVNSYTYGDQDNSSVTSLNDGGFLVTWESKDESGDGIFGKRFDANGNEVEWVGTYNPEPENPNLGLETTSDNILVAALNLSARAYSDAHHDDQSVSSAINEHIKNWKPLEATDLGFSATDSRFSKVGGALDGDLLRYDYFHASATVGLTILDGKRTLGIAFEGTNSPSSLDGLFDLVSDVSYLKGYYNLLKDSKFIPSVVEYINTNDIEQVLVTGHSLGGAAAQSFMNDYGQHDVKFMGVTFGSPGTLQLQQLPKDRFVNIQHNGDPVVNASQHITHQNIVHGAIINADVEDSGLDGLLREHTLYTPLDNSKASYRETIEFITSQLDPKVLFQDMNIVPGTDGNDSLNARAGKNGEILLGGRGNDTLKGGLIDGLDTQLFKGGLGNDTIDGDGGIDYALYGGARSNFVLQKDSMVLLNDFLFPDKWTISDQRSVPGSEGIDTLESIERLNFTDSALALDLGNSAGKVAKLIGAVFGAESVSKPEYVAVGLYYLDNGTSYEDLATGAIQLAGANTHEQVVTLLWTNVVGSPPTADQMQPFVTDLVSGQYTTGSLGVLAAEHGINLTNINLTGLVENGIAFDPSYYQPIV